MNGEVFHRRNFLLHLQERVGFERPVLIKEPARELPTPSHSAQLHNEYAITERLADVPGVRPAYAKEGSESRPVLLLEYIHGQTVTALIQTAALDISEKLRLAAEIAGTLSRIHQHQVMHRDINPSNIIVADDGAPCEQGAVYIIDFGIATAAKLARPGRLVTDETLIGTLAYISPEQSGRMNRAVDYRTDLYSLGVSLYELFTARLPFQASDALEMVHCHVAQSPVPPHDIDAGIPRPVSDIILKLMAKNAQDRYQSASGLQADLRRCLAQLQTTGRIEPSDLGRDDFTDRLQIPKKLYGRQAEIDQLLVTFGRVIHGNAELLLVAGYAGVGKTSLVHEIHKPIVAKRGYFSEGKFDQYQREIPYHAWGQAFTELVNQWQTESEAELARWRGVVLDAVGQNGQVLIDIIPDLELVIGPQPEVPELGGIEARNRFIYLFQHFVRAVATPDHPLVIFLDDLQWVDLASLNLLKTLLTDPDSGHFLVIGAYRDNEVDASHTLMLGINDLQEAGCAVNQLTLGNLARADINRLLVDSTSAPSEQCLPLAQLVHAKTDGNAFFTHQLLHKIEYDGLLSFDHDGGSWQWDMAELEKLTISDNVVDLMVSKVSRLPAASLEALKIAACLGSQFDTAILSLVSSQTLESTRQALQAVYQEGLLIELNGSAQFAHDRIQQAAYSLVPGPEKAPLHQQIGRTLLSEIPTQARDERLFDVVGHLNLGASLIDTEAAKVELAELNLGAAENALRAVAYASAKTYAETAIDLLAANGWQAHYRLTLKMHQLAAEAAYLNLDYEQSEHYIATVLANAQSLIDQVPAYIIKIRLYNAQNLSIEAIETGLAVLDELGFPLVESEPAGVSVQAISELAPMTDPRAIAAVELIDNLLLPAHVARLELFPSLVYSALHLNLKFGLHSSSCMIVVAYAAFLWCEDIDKAYQFGELALQLVEKPKAHTHMCQVRSSFGGYVLPWKSHFRTVERALRSSVQIGLEIGDKTFAMASLRNVSYLNVLLCQRLDQAQEKMTQDIRSLEQSGERVNLFNVLVWTQFVVNLRGRSDDPLCFEGSVFDEASDLPLAEAAGQHHPTYYLRLLKLILHYHLGHVQAAYAYSEEAEPFLPSFRSFYLVPWLPFYQSLAILQLLDGQDRQADLDRKLTGNLRKLQLWAHHAPMNHQHKVDLILAEQARVAGDLAAAMDHYEAAIAGAREHEYIHEEALANELYGRFWHERGNERFATIFLREAHELYSRWGAVAIVEHLETQYPQVLITEAVEDAQLQSTLATGAPQSRLDLRTVLKASQSIAGEIELEPLLGRLMDIVAENTGAQRGFLLLERDGQWEIQASTNIDKPEPQTMQGISITEADLLATGIVRFVSRTRQTVKVGDATESKFSQDAYIQDRQVRSLLCVPLLNQGRISAILYLENNLAADVFMSDRMALIEMLIGQMAVAVDNARLYDQLGKTLTTRTRDLNSAEAQIQFLFENTDLGIALTTFEGQVIAVNQALIDLTGYTEAEMQQRNIAALYHDPSQRVLLVQELQSKQSVRGFGVRARRKDETDFFANLHVSLVTHEERDVLLTIVEDVTDVYRAEEALKALQVLLQSALDALSANIAVLDTNGVIIMVNASWRAFAEENGLAWADHGLGRSYLDPLVGATAHSAVGAAEAATGIQAILSGQRDSFSLDYACHSPSEERWFTMIANCFESSEGMRIVVSHEDITHRVQAERHLEQAAVASERDRVAHELHDSVTQSLFSTTLFAQASRKGIDSGDLDGAAHHLTRILETSHQALKEMRLFIYDLLPGQLAHLGLVDAIQQRLNTVEKRAGIQVSFTAGELGDLPDRVNTALYRITQEALNNSLKHSQADVARVTIHRQGQRLCLEIIDDGQGFDPLEARGRGGLGLVSMRERTERLGGEFNIDSVPQGGTKIRVVLEVSA